MGQTTSKQNQEIVETKPIIKQEVPPPSSTFTPYLDLISIKGIESQFVKRGWPNFDNINDQIGLSPYPMLGVTALSLVTAMRYIRTPYGPFAQIGLLGTTGVFGLSSWTIKEDMDNGPSTATAWSIAYLMTYAAPSFKTKKPLPIMMTVSVMGTAFIYGKEMLDFLS